MFGRRTFLSFLGLAPAVALGSESVREVPDNSSSIQMGQNFSKSQCATALRRLAEGIEKDSVLVNEVSFNSDLKVDRMATHRITFEVIYLPEVS